MLVLSTFRRLLSQVLTGSDDLHTAVLATLTGNLVSYASEKEIQPTKSEIRTIIGLACEIWGEDEKEDSVMAETDVCQTFQAIRIRLNVYPLQKSGKFFVQTIRPTNPPSTPKEAPLLLLCLSASEGTSWQEISGRVSPLGPLKKKQSFTNLLLFL